jgi:hypothetical protein
MTGEGVGDFIEGIYEVESTKTTNKSKIFRTPFKL